MSSPMAKPLGGTMERRRGITSVAICVMKTPAEILQEGDVGCRNPEEQTGGVGTPEYVPAVTARTPAIPERPVVCHRSGPSGRKKRGGGKRVMVLLAATGEGVAAH